jgi:hypothetical protein
MGYYVRAFCKSHVVPTIGTVEEALRSGLPHARFETSELRTSNQWSQIELHYKGGKDPVVVEININTGPESLAAEECLEFVEAIGDPQSSKPKAHVIEHLRSTRYIVCCQLLSDIDDDGFEANGQLLDYFVDKHEGIIQADGEGFYDGRNLAVELK